jgi:hypothetical protein
MSEEEDVPETPDKAVRGWLVAIGFTLVLVGGEMMAEKDGARFVMGTFLVCAALPFYLSAALWKVAKEHLTAHQLSTVRAVSNDFRWWMALLLALLVYFALAPFFQERLATWFGSSTVGIIEAAIFICAVGTLIAIVAFKHVKAPGLQASDPSGSIREQLNAERQARIDAEQRLTSATILLNNQLRTPKVGPLSTLNMFWALCSALQSAARNDQVFFITAPDENASFKKYLYGLFEAAGSILTVQSDPITAGKGLLIREIDSTKDLDAPKLILAQVPGIIVHGIGPTEDGLITNFGNYFITRKASKPDEKLSTYYKKKIVWIEIGPGWPWKEGARCEE